MKNLIAIRTADYRLRTNLQSFRTTIGMSDSSTKNHATTSWFFLATSLKHSGFLRESVLHVDVPFFQNTDAVARDHHVFRWIHVHLDHDGTVDLPFDAWRWIFTAYTASLIKHMGSDTTKIRADENLKGSWFIVTNETNNWESISSSILHCSSRTFRLITSSVLLLGLTDNLQLYLSICRSSTCKLYKNTILKYVQSNRRFENCCLRSLSFVR